jgi:molybdopterin-containing oxidoreductase family iron-sulfur binding subunit
MAKDTRHDAGVSRREFASVAAAAAAGFLLTACGPRRLHEIPKDRLRKAIADWEHDYSQKYGKAVTVSDSGPMPGVLFAMALDLSRCNGSRRCVEACVAENNQSRDPQVQWIRVLSMDKDKGIDFADADPYYAPATVPEPGRFYVPTACQHCRNPPCTKVCPVGATWTEKDGIVVIDYDWCIGCRCCVAACPYGARHFN